MGEFKAAALLGRHAQLDGIGLNDVYRLGRVAEQLEPGRGPQRHDPGRRRAAASRSAAAPAACSPTSPTTPRSRRTEPVDPRPIAELRRHADAPGRYRAARWTRATRSTRSRRTRSCAGRLVYREVLPGARGALRRARRSPCTTRSPRASRHAGIDRAVRAPGRGDRPRCAPERASSSRPAPRRASRSATRCRSSSRSCRGRRDTALLDLPHQGARAGPAARRCARGSCPACAPSPTTATPPRDDRAWARKNANVVLTNPEMLHVGHPPVAQALGDVPDAAALRRGRRAAHAARHLRQSGRARAAAPAAAVRALRRAPDVLLRERDDRQPRRARVARCAGCPVEAIDDDGSPRAERVLACWQRPLLDEHSGARASANVETAELLARFVRAGHQTLAFTRSRRGAELVAAARAPPARRRRRPGSARRVAAYRAGYLARGAARARARPRRAAGCSASRPRTRSSSASTSAASTRSILNGFPGHARVDVAAGRARRAHRPAVGGGARRRRRPARPVVRRAPATS